MCGCIPHSPPALLDPTAAPTASLISTILEFTAEGAFIAPREWIAICVRWQMKMFFSTAMPVIYRRLGAGFNFGRGINSN